MKGSRNYVKNVLTMLGMCLLIMIACGKDSDDDTVSDIDGNAYGTVKIGTQVWMTENLKTTRYNDGAAITLVEERGEFGGSSGWINMTSEAYCWYDNDQAANKDTYGALYNWYAVETGKLCPPGWHVPSHEEWSTLISYTGGNQGAGTKLKSKNGWHENKNGSDQFKFAALPGGIRPVNGWFSLKGQYGFWWSSGRHAEEDGMWFNEMSYFFEHVRQQITLAGSGHSVRCIKDQGE
jgi:uncharacterized protein (TIGR02145 family)